MCALRQDGNRPNRPPGEDIRAQVWERLAEKASAYDYEDLVSTFPPLHHFSPDAVWVGTFSRTVPSKKLRLLLKPAVRTEGRTHATPPQIARAYLDIKFPKQLRACKAQIDFWKPRRVQPMYTLPGMYNKEMCYVDLVAAYWSILSLVGWDVDYFPGILVRRSSVCDFPYPEDKLARNSLVSLGLPGVGILYKDGKVILVPHSWRVNVGLWSAIQDILNGVADDMVKRAGAVYVNTDGYIIPAENINVAYGIAEEWGLPIREKHRGRATVYGVGAYSIGAKRCSHARKFAPSMQAINPYYKRGLKRMLKFLSENPR